MRHPFICSKCRQDILFRVARYARAKPDSRRGFISLRQDGSKDRVPLETKTYSPSTGSLLGTDAKKKPLPSFNPLPRVDHALTDLFIAKERIGPSAMSRYSRTLFPTQEKTSDVPKLEPSQLEKDLGAIDEALKDADGTLKDPTAAWTRFKQSSSFRRTLDPSERSLVDKQLLQDSPVLTELLMRIVRLRTRKRQYRESVNLPEVIGWYSDLGLMEERWTPVLYKYITSLLFNVDHPKPNPEHHPVYVSRLAVLQDLCRMWKWFLETFKDSERCEEVANPVTQAVLAEMGEVIEQKHGDNVGPQSLDRRLPNISEMFLFNSVAGVKLLKPLTKFCISRRGNLEGKVLALAAVLTCHLIHSFKRGKDHWNKIVLDNEVHNNFVAFALYGRWLDKASIIEAYPRMNLNYKSHIAVRDAITLLRKESADPVAKTTADLNKAISERNVKYAESVWHHFLQQAGTGKISSEVQMELYGPFLTAFLALRRTQVAIDVWNSMIQSGQQPRSEHWLIMLEGAANSGGINALNGIWDQIRAASIRPNNDMWRYYLRGLLKYGRYDEGLAAAKDMGRSWISELSAQQPSPQDETAAAITKTTRSQASYLPHMKPINSMIVVLQNTWRKDQVQKLLDWAASFNLQPDVETYRFLLLKAVRDDNVDQVNQLLRDMDAAKVAPDVKIFTILMDFAFRNQHSDFQRQSGEQQREIIAKVLADMEEAGIQADAHTYGTLLSGLLKPPCLNVVAARAVLEQVAEKGIPISPHIHTILIGHYFSQDPPDLAAVDSLWAKIQLEKHHVDSVFFDRMMQEYARLGELEKMLIFLRKMVRSGKVPGWLGLKRVLQVLVDAREWGWVQDLLNDVVDERGLFRYGSRSENGKEEFWELVERIRGQGVVELPRRPADVVIPLLRKREE